MPWPVIGPEMGAGPIQAYQSPSCISEALSFRGMLDDLL